MKLAVFLFLLCAMTLPAQNPSRNVPELIFLHGNIYTGAELGLGGSPARVYPRAQAIAVAGDRIVAVGTDDEIRKLKSARTQVIDLAGQFVMPGFNDAHVHLASGGFEQMEVDLVGTRSLEEMKQRIAERARTAASGEWILGRGWDDTKWSTTRMPTRQDLDAVTGDHPASFSRVDGHMLVANSAALNAAGITRNTPDPAHGRIDHDAQGEPAGGLREMAQDLLTSKIPPPTPAQRRRAAELALLTAAQSGLTSAQDNSAWEDFLTYADLEDEGKLTLRITEWLPFPASLKVLDQHRDMHSQLDPMLHTGMLKGFMDGSLGSHTAAMLQPYTDDPKNSGLPQYEQSQLDRMADERAAAGYQMGFHAIGDRGVAMALQAFGEAQRYVREHNPNAPQLRQPGGFRFRVEHAQVVAPDQ